MESYNGCLYSIRDALNLVEAARVNRIPTVKVKLSALDKRSVIKVGNVIIYDSSNSELQRWTDGKYWSGSRLANFFLTYRELEADLETDKANGLIKQTFSIRPYSCNSHFHLIYYTTPENFKLIQKYKNLVRNKRNVKENLTAAQYAHVTALLNTRPIYQIKGISLSRGFYPDHLLTYKDDIIEPFVQISSSSHSTFDGQYISPSTSSVSTTSFPIPDSVQHHYHYHTPNTIPSSSPASDSTSSRSSGRLGYSASTLNIPPARIKAASSQPNRLPPISLFDSHPIASNNGSNRPASSKKRFSDNKMRVNSILNDDSTSNIRR